MKWRLAIGTIALSTSIVLGLACGGGEEAPSPVATATAAPVIEVEPTPAPAEDAEVQPGEIDPSLPPVKLGHLITLTGVAASTGAESLWGGEVAINEANAAGGFNGREFVALRYDEGYGAETVVASTKKALADGIVAMIGAWDATTCVPMKDILKEENFPVAVGPCGSEKVTTEGYHGAVHVTHAHNSLQLKHNLAGAVIQWLWENAGPKLALVSTDSQYCRNVETELHTVFERLKPSMPDLEIVDISYFPYGAAEARVEITKAIATEPDGAYFCQWGKQQVVSNLKTARDLGFTKPIVVTVFDQPEAQELGFELTRNTFGANGWYFDPETASPEALAFNESIGEISGGTRTANDIMEAYYTGTKLMTEAIKRAGSTEKEKIIDAMYEVSFKTPRGEWLTFDEKGMRRTPYMVLVVPDEDGNMRVEHQIPYGTWVDGRFISD